MPLYAAVQIVICINIHEICKTKYARNLHKYANDKYAIYVHNNVHK